MLSDYEVREVAGEYMIIPIGKAMAKHRGFISCDKCAAEFFNCIKNGKDKSETIRFFLENSDATEKQLSEDYDNFLEQMKKLGIE